ncbi:MAG TPA: glycoside hydrolase family 38 C-terminal domain-containing protein [Terracidiphilus sp.]|jgi:alpha-mannosidase
MKSIVKARLRQFALLFVAAILTIATRGMAQSTDDAAKVVGDWTSTLSAGGTQLHLALHVIAGKDGSLGSTVDSLDQGEYATPTTTTAFKNSKLTFSIASYNVTFEGTLNKDATEIDGTLTQGQGLPLQWKRASAQSGVISAVIGRLSALHTLPDGKWKLHTGDVAHGEAVDLDDSSWQTVAPGTKVSNDAVWFRQTITIPDTLHGYDLTGARIWLDFHIDADRYLPEILYFDGRRVAMGDDIEPTVLVDHAKPGEKIAVALKLLHTAAGRTFNGATLRIESADNRPNPDDLRLEFLTASELVPSLAPNDPAPMATLDSAIRTVDLAALDTADQAKFDASLKASQEKLQPLKPLLQQATFHLTGQSHIDAAWLWPWTETVDVVKRTFGTALQLMYEYPQYTYSQSAAAYYEWMAQKYPDMNAEIARRIKEGRWEVVGGMWVEPDLNMPDGESLVRQLLVGKRWFKQAYGVDVRIGWNPDSFGYTLQLPQIYKKSGVDYFVTTKMTWNDTNQLPFKLFWWQSPDGSKVLSYFPPGLSTDLNPARLGGNLAERRKMAPGETELMDIYGVGDHGGGPTRDLLDEGFHWTKPGLVVPKYQFGLALPFFTSIEKKIAPQSPSWDYASIAKGYTPPAAVPGKVAIPTWTSDLYLEFHRGVYTTQANHKRNMRDAEVEVLNAEKWASLAWLDGRKYPAAEITEDWKKVLFNQFHDLAAGSGIGVIYKDAQKDYNVVRWSTNEIGAGALKTVAEQIDTHTKEENAVPVLVYNPLGWERSGDVTVKVQLPKVSPLGVRVTDASQHVIVRSDQISVDKQTGMTEIRLNVDHVPALGYKLLEISPENAADQQRTMPVKASETGNTITLESNPLRVEIDKHTGCVTSLYDKRSNFETLAKGACGNELQAFKDKPKEYDAWNIDPGTLDVPPTLLHMTDSVEFVGADTSSPAVRVTRTWQSSKFVQTISLTPESDQVDIDNEIDWHETHVLLKAAFPLAASGPFATFEVPYGTIERPTTRNNSWEKAQFEVPAMRWGDLGDGKHGLSVINNSKYGYDAVGNVLRLTLLRSPVDPDPDADRGHHHFHYALYPHAGTWKDAMTVRHGYEYNYPLTAVVTSSHPGSLPAEHSFASVEPENVVLTAVKKAEDANGLIFRVYEWAGKDATAEFHVPAGATGATVTNMMETAEGSPLPVSHPTAEGDEVKVPIHPYEILTIRVDYPNGGPKQ